MEQYKAEAKSDQEMAGLPRGGGGKTCKATREVKLGTCGSQSTVTAWPQVTHND